MKSFFTYIWSSIIHKQILHMIKRIIPICLFAALLPSIAIFAQPKLVEKVVKKGDEITIPYEKYVFPNGLTVILHEDRSDPLVHVDVTYHVGSAREEIGKSGFAHFFEHMMFQGSDNVADEQHFKLVTESGGTLNGTTNRDRTNYFQTVPNNQLEKMLWLEADRMGFLLDAVTVQKFEIQRSTVKNERGQNYDNRPYGLTREVAAKNLYPYGHPYSWLTIGYIEDLNRSTVDDLKNFFLRWYGPNNATLTVGGDIDIKQTLVWIEKYFGSIPRGPEVTPAKYPLPVLDKTRYVSHLDNYARTPSLTVMYPTPQAFHADEAALDCLSEIIGQGRTSLFYQSMVKTQEATSASARNSTTELSGEFTISVMPYPNKSLAQMLEMVDAALEEFEKRGVTDEDIQKFKASFISGTINRLGSVSGKVSQLAYYQTFAKDPKKFNQELKAYQSITKADVMRVYNKYIKGKHRLVVSTLTKGKEDLIAGPDNYTVNESGYKAPDYGYAGLKYNKANDNFDRSKVPGSGTNPIVRVPPYYEAKLPNGIRVIGTENTELPTVFVSISLKGGRLMEADKLDKAGWTSLVARMLNEDTKNYSSEQFTDALDKLGSSVSVGNSTDAIVFSMQTLKVNLDKSIALLEERMLRPNFNEEDLTRIKKELSERIKNSKTTASSVASDVYSMVNYGEHSILGLPFNGTLETLENITLDDINEYYNNYLTSEDGRMVIVGDVKKDVVSKFGFLQKLPRNSFKLPGVGEGLPVAKTKIYLVDIPRAAQTEFRIGMPLDLTYDATGEYYRAFLTNYNLGAAFNSRLNINLREDKGWTYGARSGFSSDKYSGMFTFSSGIRADATDSALLEILSEIKTFAKDGIKDDEIKFMQQSLGQSDARSYETNGQKASFLGRMLQYDLEPSFVDQQNKILAEIQKSTLDEIAAKYLDVNKMNIVLVGDAKVIRPGLEKLGFEIVELDANGKKK